MKSTFRYRLLIVACGLFSLFSLLIMTFFNIQIIQHKKWNTKARQQHFFVVHEPFLRGTFYSHSKDPVPLVIEVQKFHLHADPFSIPEEERASVAKGIAKLLDLSPREEEEVVHQLDKTSRNRRLTMWLEAKEKEALLKWWTPYARQKKIARNALFFEAAYQRSYPYGAMLGQVLHTVQGHRDELTGQAIPTGGLELYFNRYLQGKIGSHLLMRSPRNALELGAIKSLPENGADIYLTIDHVLQAIVEDELAKGVEKAKAKGGWAVMMDPYTGEILALAQFPLFHPMEIQSYFNHREEIEHTRLKAVTDANEPGSIFKPFTTVAALLANEELKAQGKPPLFDVEEAIPCKDGRFPGRSRPIVDASSAHYLNFYMGLKKSSNIYMGRLTQRIIDRMGEEWFSSVFTDRFQFGKKTGIEFPGESAGVYPRIGKMHPNGKLEWSKPTPYSIAMGYNLQATMLQMASAYSILANGGYSVRPTLVEKIVKGEQILYRPPPFHPSRVLPSSVVEEVLKGVRFVTMPGGTSSSGNIPGFTEIGKSGTARKLVEGLYTTKKHLANFAGFAPAIKPRFVLCITLNEPEVKYIPGVGKNHHGGTCAAPIFREIGKRALAYLGVPPDDPYGYPPPDPRYNPQKAVWMEENRLLREKYEKWNNPASGKL